MLNDKIISDLKKLIEIAKNQNNKINSSIVLMSIDKNNADFSEIVNYFLEHNIELINEDIEVDEETAATLDPENIRPFDPTKIDITMKPYTIDLLCRRINNKEIELDSSFQRKSGLWSDIQKSQLIESLLLRIPLPAFYFDATSEDKWLIIDGLQRTSVFKEFILEKKFKLKGLEFFTELNNCTYDSLPRIFQRRIEETQINIYLVNPGTPENVKFNIFKRINTGGLALTTQEIRNALYQGNATVFLTECSNLSIFKEATGYSIKSDRMLDKEFVLRYIAFSCLDTTNYNGIVDDFLNDAMKYINNASPDTLMNIKTQFIRSMKINQQLFERHAFRKMSYDGRRRPINKVLFELWSSQLGKLTDKDIKILCNNKNILLNNFINLCESNSFASLLKASDKYALKSRMQTLNKLIFDIIGGNDDSNTSAKEF
ncbi:DUF262 domain-containing protein [Anaeromicropila herbilytica]|uniref:GmrSD restriction endonucleases N-terminal domain-containing protein n=1 Tax=Anaeromicropila herbilytica TaxID=2785025 RepID=A0A7R7EQD9_9FIRM|nr:DUF262 domain-containing protein [Anaeromicropila herbilytica]BCN32612.1 hypothetical protein bsdtb5_39070 [Anaeromicropila herbilytica]